MEIRNCIFKAFLCLLLAIVAGGHSAGRRLRIRSEADLLGSESQYPWVPMVQANALQPRKPVVHFLFLATDRINNLDVWKSFFARAPKDEYRAFVHCKAPECAMSLAGSPLVPIATVPSYYCADLVTPMNHLLNQALQNTPGRNSADKFVFVSDSTLPAKPFSHIYETLTARSGSDFCVCSVNEWATRREQPAGSSAEGKGVEMAVKHHQWSVLERSHAEKVAQIWSAGPSVVQAFMMRFEMHLPPRSRSVKTFAGSSDTGCLDEFYHMAAVYGTFPYVDPSSNTSVNLPAFTNTPLRIATAGDLQGSCDTFVAWPEYAKGRDISTNTTLSNGFKRLYANLDPLSVPYSGNAHKPGYWDTISSHGMRAIRVSEFLFVRKFIDHPKVADGGSFGTLYPQVVFL